MIIVMLVVMVETTGDSIAIGEIVDKPIGRKELASVIRADGISTLIGGILNSFPYTAFAQNVGPVSYTHLDVYKRQCVDRFAGGTHICRRGSSYGCQ